MHSILAVREMPVAAAGAGRSVSGTDGSAQSGQRGRGFGVHQRRRRRRRRMMRRGQRGRRHGQREVHGAGAHDEARSAHCSARLLHLPLERVLALRLLLVVLGEVVHDDRNRHPDHCGAQCTGYTMPQPQLTLNYEYLYSIICSP